MIKWKGEDDIHSASIEIEELTRMLVTQKENYTNAMRNLEVYSGKVYRMISFLSSIYTHVYFIVLLK